MVDTSSALSTLSDLNRSISKQLLLIVSTSIIYFSYLVLTTLHMLVNTFCSTKVELTDADSVSAVDARATKGTSAGDFRLRLSSEHTSFTFEPDLYVSLLFFP